MNIKYTLVVIASITLSSCAPTVLPADDSLIKKVHLPFNFQSIKFVDMRTDTSSQEMKLPLFASRQREWTIRPGLTDLKKEIITIIKEAGNQEGINSSVTVFINDGYYKIAGNFKQVGEYTLFNCSLEFTIDGSVRKITSTAEATYDYMGAFNATEEHAKKVYKITARNAINKSLKIFQKTLDNLNN